LNELKNLIFHFKNSRYRKRLVLLFKYILGIASYGYVFIKILRILQQGAELNIHATSLTGLLLFVVCSLVYINWYLEAVKWRILIKPILSVPVKMAYKAVLAGINLGMVSPNRIGEPFGRAIYMNYSNKKQLVVASLAGGMAQFLITLLMGLVAFFISFVIREHTIDIHTLLSKRVLLTWSIIIGIIFAVPILLYYIQLIDLKRYRFIKEILSSLVFIKEYRFSTQFRILVLSLLRYLVFTCQLLLLLNICNIRTALIQTWVCISLMYLMVAILPRNTITEFGLRGSILIALMAPFTENHLGVFIAVSLLWIINVGIPALIGNFYMLRKK
jgi:hypothetical protein